MAKGGRRVSRCYALYGDHVYLALALAELYPFLKHLLPHWRIPRLAVSSKGSTEPPGPLSDFDRFEGGVVIGVGVATAEAGLGGWFVSVVQPATFAEMLRKAPNGGVLTFFQRLIFSKKQATEN